MKRLVIALSLLVLGCAAPPENVVVVGRVAPRKPVTADELRRTIADAKHSDIARGDTEIQGMLDELSRLNECFAWMEGAMADVDSGKRTRESIAKDIPPVCADKPR